MGDRSTLVKLGLFGAAFYLAYKQGWLSSLGLSLSTSTSTISTSTATTATPTTTPATTTPVSTSIASNSSSTLDTLYSTMTAKAKAAGEPSSLGVDAWGYYLNQSGISAPDPLPIFSAAIQNFDRSQTFTGPAYWAIMAPALKTQLGLSGLGIYGGLGALMRRYA